MPKADKLPSWRHQRAERRDEFFRALQRMFPGPEYEWLHEFGATDLELSERLGVIPNRGDVIERDIAAVLEIEDRFLEDVPGEPSAVALRFPRAIFSLYDPAERDPNVDPKALSLFYQVQPYSDEAFQVFLQTVETLPVNVDTPRPYRL